MRNSSGSCETPSSLATKFRGLCRLVNVKIVMQATLNREPNNLSTNIGYV
jgi:hypothetical protein